MKRLLSLALCLMMLLVAVGCAPKTDTQATTQPDGQTDGNTETSSGQFSDSPYLAGKGLPPVADRLPKEPKIPNTVPLEHLQPSVGKYGGVIRTITHEGGFDAMAFCMNNEPVLNSPGLIGDVITGNVFKDWSVTEDQKVFTFTLREGMKWSDGEPVIMDDVKFAFEDLIFNEEYATTISSWMRVGASMQGEPGTFKVIDDWTFQIAFPEGYGGFPFILAISGWKGYTDLLKPKHVLEQYHPTYNSRENIDQLAAELNFEMPREKDDPTRWVDVLNFVDTQNWSNTDAKSIGFPNLQPWCMVRYDEASQTKFFERNPYYFKVDANGQQLPYIDELVSYNVADLEMLGMKVVNGEVDHSCEHIEVSRLAFYQENADNGGYKIWMPLMHRTGADIFLNHTVGNPTLNAAYNDVKFKEALNLSIDKKDLIETIYLGFAEPWAPQNTGREYDLAKANKILDDAGYTKGTNGKRNAPDGSVLGMYYEAAPNRPDTVPISELVNSYWQELGIDISFRQVAEDLRQKRLNANELEVTTGWTSGPVMWTYFDYGEAQWGYLWNQYYNTNGEQGEAPPEHIAKFFTERNKIMSESLEEGRKSWQNCIDIIADEYLFFILADKIKSPSAINAKMQNYTNEGWGIAQYFGPEIFWYEQ